MYMFRTYEPPVDDPLALAEALRSLQPGQALVYHRGHLWNAPQAIRIVKDMAYVLFEAKKVLLVQRRLSPPINNGGVDWQNGIGKGVEYIAIGAKSPAK